MVRGLCTLRPGVPGGLRADPRGEPIGRFLEHARIYQFGARGDAQYYIGSADWRSRNLRRRVEVVVPVEDPAARERLTAQLDRELADPQAWVLHADGSYGRGGRDGP